MTVLPYPADLLALKSLNLSHLAVQPVSNGLIAYFDFEKMIVFPSKQKNEFEYFILPLNKFPNGPHFYSYHEILDPYIVHFNYIQGEEKIAKMKKLNHWYV